MDTSRFSDQWLASVSVYSGRQDPEWVVPSAIAAELAALWDRLGPIDESSERVPTALGYRGCRLRSPDGREWNAWMGVVVRHAAGRRDVRGDEQREFERALLATAPDGLLPPKVTQEIWRHPK